MRFSAHPFFLRTSRHTAHLALMAPLLAPLALASPALVHAAGAGTEPAVRHGAADPDAPTAPPTHQSLGPQPLWPTPQRSPCPGHRPTRQWPHFPAAMRTSWRGRPASERRADLQRPPRQVPDLTTTPQHREAGHEPQHPPRRNRGARWPPRPLPLEPAGRGSPARRLRQRVTRRPAGRRGRAHRPPHRQHIPGGVASRRRCCQCAGTAGNASAAGNAAHAGCCRAHRTPEQPRAARPACRAGCGRCRARAGHHAAQPACLARAASKRPRARDRTQPGLQPARPRDAALAHRAAGRAPADRHAAHGAAGGGARGRHAARLAARGGGAGGGRRARPHGSGGPNGHRAGPPHGARRQLEPPAAGPRAGRAARGECPARPCPAGSRHRARAAEPPDGPVGPGGAAVHAGRPFARAACRPAACGGPGGHRAARAAGRAGRAPTAGHRRPPAGLAPRGRRVRRHRPGLSAQHHGRARHRPPRDHPRVGAGPAPALVRLGWCCPHPCPGADGAQCSAVAGHRRARPRRGACRVADLPHSARPGAPAAGRGRAAAPVHHRRDHPALQRHARQRVGAAGPGAQQHPGRGRCDQRTARLLAGRDRPATGPHRYVARYVAWGPAGPGFGAAAPSTSQGH